MPDDAISSTATRAPLCLDEPSTDSMKDAPLERSQRKLQQEFNPVITVDDSDDEMGLAEEKLWAADPEIRERRSSMQTGSEPAHAAVLSHFAEDKLLPVMQRELLSELRGQLLAWQLGCRAVTIGKLWQLHADVSRISVVQLQHDQEQAADPEEMVRLGAHIQSLRVGKLTLAQGGAGGFDKCDRSLQKSPDVSLRFVELPQPAIQPQTPMADMQSLHGEAMVTCKPETESHIEVTSSDAALMVANTEILFLPEVGKSTLPERVVCDMPHIKPPAPEMTSKTSRDTEPDVLVARPHDELARSWLSCVVCSRRSQQASKRKVAQTIEESCVQVRKHARL